MIAARRAGAEVHFIAMLGKDPFGQMALDLYSDDINTDFVFQTEEKDTGAADIMVDDVTGDNAIIVVPELQISFSARWKRPKRPFKIPVSL